MRLKLTEDELATVRKVILRHEKRARWGKLGRWVGVIASPSIIALSAWQMTVAQSFWSRQSGMLEAGSRDEPPGAAATKADIALLRTETAMSLTTLLMCSLCATQGLFLCAIGAVLLAFTVAKWNRHKEDAVVVRVLRFFAEECAEPS